MNRTPGIVAWVILGFAAVLLAIPASFGPAVWLQSRYKFRRTKVERVYAPILWAAVYGPEPVKAAVHWWGELGVPHGEMVLFAVQAPDGGTTFVCFRTHPGL